MVKIGFILGTRPEIIKLYSCIEYCEESDIPYFVINTDQHYDKNMRDVFFEELGLKPPQYSLSVGSGSHARMLASMLPAIEDVLLEEKPGVVVVQGDTNTVLAGGLVAAKMGIKVAHVEAGLRSYDRDMPEEYNRVLVDHCSDYLFAPTEKQKDILLGEGISQGAVFVTGNTIVDAVQKISNQAKGGPGYAYKYVLLTCHRPSNTDDPSALRAILSAIQSICERDNLRCIFPVHPRLNSQRNSFKKYDRIELREPLGYSQLLQHIKGAEMIFTDSGGIQEESCILQKKCIILRANTERPETVEVGGAVLLNMISRPEIEAKYTALKDKDVTWYNPFGDGHAAKRIIDVLV
jgi:UDP-N-acetylglucosamine 2-epimerase (non-hydrolysing)